jgi:hypothetical protein
LLDFNNLRRILANQSSGAEAEGRQFAVLGDSEEGATVDVVLGIRSVEDPVHSLHERQLARY